jgi:hypothetical protein
MDRGELPGAPCLAGFETWGFCFRTEKVVSRLTITPPGLENRETWGTRITLVTTDVTNARNYFCGCWPC